MLGLRNIYDLLEPGGRAVILVPQGDGYLRKSRQSAQALAQVFGKELRSKTEQPGFQVEHVLQFNRVTRPAWFMNGRILQKQMFQSPSALGIRPHGLVVETLGFGSALERGINHCNRRKTRKDASFAD
jgi:hypothetical protein